MLKARLPKTDLLEKQIQHLQAKYGLNALQIVESSSSKELTPLSTVIPLCKAEIIHDINHEHAKTATDILARRNRLAMVNLKEAEKLLPIVQEHLSNKSLPDNQLNLEK